VDQLIAETEGKIRQMAYVAPLSNTTLGADVAAKQIIAADFDSKSAPMHILLGVRDASLASYSALINLRTLNSPNISVVAMSDGAGKGNTISTSLGVPGIPAVGTVLGAIAKASVHESIAWINKFNLSDGTEFSKVRDAKGTLISHPESMLDAVNTNAYIFFRSFVGLAGAYLNDSHTATTTTSDYATIENNRVIGKAKRLIKAALLPDLNAPLTVEASGKLAADTVRYFENKVSTQMDFMQNDGEMSNYSVLVDPEQNVLSTSTLTIQVRIQPRGVARNIVINIGLAAKVSL
jgi:hypothetical protein